MRKMAAPAAVMVYQTACVAWEKSEPEERLMLTTVPAMATPEMASYFAEQLNEQVSRGVRNSVTDVNLISGDLAQAVDGVWGCYDTRDFSAAEYCAREVARIVGITHCFSRIVESSGLGNVN